MHGRAGDLYLVKALQVGGDSARAEVIVLAQIQDLAHDRRRRCPWRTVGSSRPVGQARFTHCGRICIGRRKINLSTAFAGQTVGVREVDDQIWLVSFLNYDLGYFDNERGRVEPAPNPFAPDKVLTMCPEQGVNHVTGMDQKQIGAPGKIRTPDP